LREEAEDEDLAPEEDKVPSRADEDLAESLVCPAAVERADAVPARVEEALDEVPLPLAEALVSLSFARRAVVPVPLVLGRTLRSAAAAASLEVAPVAREDVEPTRAEARLVFASALEEAPVEPSGTTLVRGLPGPLVAVEEAVELPLAARVADADVALVEPARVAAVFFTDFSSLFEF
jgi:hypothetical protein